MPANALRKRARLRSQYFAELSLNELESRDTPTNVLTYHNDVASNGVNNTETTLTRANVNANQFGKLFTASVQGQVYAQPLVMQNVNITTGANAGVHDAVFVATQHDQLYAFDSAAINSTLLWQRNFLDLSLAANHLPNTTALTPLPQAESGSTDISIEIGITGTPVIDAATNTLYVVVKTKEVVGGVTHYVQRLHAINIQDGTDRNVTTIGNTTGANASNVTSIYVYGTGGAAITDPYNGTGQPVIQFSALRQHQRPALTIVNGVVYVGWASHGDNGQYHGWVAGFDKTTLALKGCFNTTPNGTWGGIWQAGGALTTDGTYLYFETGNGTFDGNNGSGTNNNTTDPAGAPGPVTGLDANGFPANGNYGDSFVKVGLDPATTPQNQGKNGWGLKVVDYFTPLNQDWLEAVDADLGSSAAIVVPDSYGTTAHPHLLIGSGKEGVIYLMDRDNMGKFGIHNNIVQNSNNELNGSLDSAAIFNGRMYYVEGYGGVAKAFNFANAAFGPASSSVSPDHFAFAGSTPSISANGLANGIVWDVDRGTNQLRAYNSDSYQTELYTSAQAPNARDALGAAVKFQVPTVANGRVYLGAGTGEPNNALVVYGILQPPNAVPLAPAGLIAQAISSTQITLAWTDSTGNQNSPDNYYVERSPNGTTGWTAVATTSSLSYVATGLSIGTAYYFRVRSHNPIGYSAYSNTASATTNLSTTHSIDFGNGFTPANTAAILTSNGTALVDGTTSRLRLTSYNAVNPVGSAFYNIPQNIGSFSTTFTYYKNGFSDGITFTVQRDPRGVAALGGGNGSLGYGNGNAITPSAALAINIWNGHALGSEFLTNGGTDFNYTQNNINASANFPITVTVNYAAGFLTATLRQGAAVDVKTLAIDLPALLGASTAYVGFTGAAGSTGVPGATQDILYWTFDQGVPPATPTNVNATLLGYAGNSTASVPLTTHLAWNAAAGASSYKIERKLTAGGTYAQVGTSTTTSYDDPGLTPGSTYYYRVRASNSVSSGSYSAEVAVTTPSLAPTATGITSDSTATNAISFHWTDNANNEDGIQITRSVNQGTFALLTTLPANAPAAPSQVSFTDSGLTPGTRYDYHVQTYNLAGYSDFAGLTTATRTLPPTGVSATGQAGQISLAWTAPTGAVSYKVYRGTTPGGESATPIASGITAQSYINTGVSFGTTYYYKITATDAGGESAYSAEVSATPTSPASLPTPTVQAVQVNDGATQRSIVDSLRVTFNGTVALSADAFTLTRPGFAPTSPAAAELSSAPSAGQGRILVATSTNALGQTVATLTFATDAGSTTTAADGVEFGSLSDGSWVLTVSAAGVTAPGGATMLADYGTPASGTAASGRIYRLFGDADGDGDADTTDLAHFHESFTGVSGTAGPVYAAAFDLDGDGDVDLADLSAFRERFTMIV